MSILIIDNYDSFTFNLMQLVQILTREEVVVKRNDAVNLTGIRSLRPSRIILSPGPGHPGNIKDFGVCADIIVNHDQLLCPILGVCLGHQGIVHYLGGKVIPAPEIVHGKSSRIVTAPSCPLFEGLTQPFEAMRYHSLIASEDDLPQELTVVGRESTHQLIMAVAHNSRPIFGVQFHPESIGTPEGTRIMENFIERC